MKQWRRYMRGRTLEQTMKAGGFIRSPLVLPLMVTALGLEFGGPASAQIFTTLHSFTKGSNDGGSPDAGLMLSGSVLYGTTGGGGSFGYGTAFKLNADGTGMTTLHSFSGGSDGENPFAVLVLSGNTLYGTAHQSSFSQDRGTVFSVNTNGTSFAILHTFPFAGDGAFPDGGLILSGSTLYGTTAGWGVGQGTVFAINTNGTGYTNLYSFTARFGSAYTNSDGTFPTAGLILSGETLYGTAWAGGDSGFGTVFAINTNGSDFATLHSFTGGDDGAHPYAGLILSGNMLYGTAYAGGNSNLGSVFTVNTNGTGFATLHGFTGGDDGANPYAGLVLSGSTLYGTTTLGTASGNGTVFSLGTNGSGFTTLHSFTATNGPASTNSDGATPYGDLIISGNTLYGTANSGGNSGLGTVFSILLPLPQLTIVLSGSSFILSWPSGASGFALQSATSLAPQPVWSTNSPAPVLVNGLNVVTNSISGTQRFFRLSQ
jgi:uncharacterized repeat protein (TIGR03803 family)